MDENLTHKQAIALVKLCAGGTDAEAAKLANVSTRTISRWKSEPGFSRTMYAATNVLLESAVANLALGADDASKELVNIIKNPETPARVKLQGINILFSICYKAKEYRMEERIQALEDRAYALNGKN